MTDRDGSDLDARTREAVTELIEKEEGAAHRLGGPVGAFLTAVAVAVSVFHLYAAYDIVSAHVLRPVHVGLVLFLSFLLYPVARAFRDTVRWWYWLLALAALGATRMKADWTRHDPAITRILEAHGRSGVPLVLFYPPGGGEPQAWPSVLNEGWVLARLRAAATPDHDPP